MTTVDDVFVDTNVLLRATIDTMPLHAEAVALITAQRAGGAALWISRQVIREHIAVSTRPQSFLVPLSTADVTARIQMFETLFNVADDTAQVPATLLALLNDYPTGGKQVHDANIVATMLTVWNQDPAHSERRGYEPLCRQDHHCPPSGRNILTSYLASRVAPSALTEWWLQPTLDRDRERSRFLHHPLLVQIQQHIKPRARAHSAFPRCSPPGVR